ncbi:MAG: hypothetical protein WAW13_00625 [Minisyncoccia bacterium]
MAEDKAPARAPEAGANLFRVFWHCGGEPVFRDHTGTIRPVHVIRLRRVIHALHRLAVEASEQRRTREHARLATILAEAQTALDDTMKWRWQAAGL